MTKDQLVSIAVERKLVRTKTEAKTMKVAELEALIASIETSDARAIEESRAERDPRAGREREEALDAQRIERHEREEREREERVAAFVPMTVPVTVQNAPVWPRERATEPARMSALDWLRALPERNRHERRRKEALLRLALRASA